MEQVTSPPATESDRLGQASVSVPPSYHHVLRNKEQFPGTPGSQSEIDEGNTDSRKARNEVQPPTNGSYGHNDPGAINVAYSTTMPDAVRLSTKM